MYYSGEGVLENYQEAMKWFSKAAAKGNASAQSNLGMMYMNGEGFEKNYIKAFLWSNLAAEKGFQAAKKNSKKLFLIQAVLTGSCSHLRQFLRIDDRRGKVIFFKNDPEFSCFF